MRTSERRGANKGTDATGTRQPHGKMSKRQKRQPSLFPTAQSQSQSQSNSRKEMIGWCDVTIAHPWQRAQPIKNTGRDKPTRLQSSQTQNVPAGPPIKNSPSLHWPKANQLSTSTPDASPGLATDGQLPA